MKRDRRAGFTLVELIVGICILIIIGAAGFTLIRQAAQRTKVVVAKANLSQYATLLESVKSEVNYYPPAVNETLESLTFTASPPGYERWWRGPYLKETPVDPWKKEYFYHLIYGIVFGPKQFKRESHGSPYDETFTFPAVPGSGTLIIDNSSHPVASTRVWLNGVEIVHPSDINPHIYTITKQLTLASDNTLRVWIPSNVHQQNYYYLTITSPFSNRTSYTIGSYGSDNKIGGDGFARDLIWIAGQSGTDF